MGRVATGRGSTGRVRGGFKVSLDPWGLEVLLDRDYTASAEMGYLPYESHVDYEIMSQVHDKNYDKRVLY